MGELVELFVYQILASSPNFYMNTWLGDAPAQHLHSHPYSTVWGVHRELHLNACVFMLAQSMTVLSDAQQ